MQLLEELEQGRPAVLLTIVGSKGSTPRKKGSHQLILAEGRSVGTIGGGMQEHLACEAGVQILRTHCSAIHTFLLHEDIAASIGMVCGGDLQVFCQYFCADMPGLVPLCRAVEETIRERRKGYLLFYLTDAARWSMGFFSKNWLVCGDVYGASVLTAQRDTLIAGTTGLVSLGSEQYYVEPLYQPGRVYIFGGGHVARELVRVLSYLDFTSVVIDDRAEFASPGRFPQAAQTVVADFENLPPDIGVTRNDYVCVMTRGHTGDYAAQRAMLRCQPCYLGVIGSRTKLAFVRQKLLGDGFLPEEIDRCRAPIGLPISAATPAEIAISIAAELIAVRARREGREKADAKALWKQL